MCYVEFTSIPTVLNRVVSYSSRVGCHRFGLLVVLNVTSQELSESLTVKVYHEDFDFQCHFLWLDPTRPIFDTLFVSLGSKGRDEV